MEYRNFTEIKDKVQRETDTEGEEFVQPLEFKGYVNDGIDEIESEIHTLGMEDEYFLNKGFIALVQGQEDYDLPTDIYANKIRKIIYNANGGSNIYVVPRLRGPDKFEAIAHINQSPTSSNDYAYILYNPSSAVKPQLQLVPASFETSATNIRVWYIRNATRWVLDTDFCDLPEIAMQTLYAYVRWRIASKEKDRVGSKFGEYQAVRKQMVDTLTNMVVDEDSTIYQDMQHYNDME